MGHLDFFYFLGSGYSYLSVMRIRKLAEDAGVSVRWRPFNVRTLMAENNVSLRSEKAKVNYMWRDIERRAAKHRLPFLRPPIWPTDPDLLANRVGIVASQEGWAEAYTVESFRAWYLEGQPLGSRASLEHIFKPLGRDADAVIGRADTPEIKELLDKETDVARSFGIFGAPSFVIGGELFWGDDRLEEAIEWAAKSSNRGEGPGQYQLGNA